MYFYKGSKFYKKRPQKIMNRGLVILKIVMVALRSKWGYTEPIEWKEYIHEAMSLTDVRLILVRELMVKDCSTTRLTKNDIIGSATAVLDDSERQQLPSVPNLERTFRNIQSKSHNLSYMNNYDVPNELLNTRSGLLFVQSDNYFVSKERLIGL